MIFNLIIDIINDHKIYFLKVISIFIYIVTLWITF